MARPEDPNDYDQKQNEFLRYEGLFLRLRNLSSSTSEIASSRSAERGSSSDAMLSANGSRSTSSLSYPTRRNADNTHRPLCNLVDVRVRPMTATTSKYRLVHGKPPVIDP